MPLSYHLIAAFTFHFVIVAGALFSLALSLLFFTKSMNLNRNIKREGECRRKRERLNETKHKVNDIEKSEKSKMKETEWPSETEK